MNTTSATLVGIGLRRPLAAWIDTRPQEVECLEITAEHFFPNHPDEADASKKYLRDLRRDYPLFVHGLGLSLGTPGPLDSYTLDQFARIVQWTDPLWISEHVAFTRSEEVDLGHLNPLRPTHHTLDIVAEHARTLIERCRKPLIVENITSNLRLDGEMTEPQFLNRLCEQAGCGLLLDVTNLYINSKNHGFDPRQWLDQLDPQNIIQLHVVGYDQQNGDWRDHHNRPIQDDLFDLVCDVLAYAPAQAMIIERDDNFPPPEDLAAELNKLKAATREYGIHHSADETAQQPRFTARV